MEKYKWVDYDTWRFWKNGYKTDVQIARERVARYLKENPGIMAQLKWCIEHPGETPVLTEEMLDEYIETLRFKETKDE